jgi:hypothetical protein
MTSIASSIPGRLRLRDRALRDDARLDALGAAAARWRGVTDVEINPRAGSLLIHYDAVRLAPATCEARAVAAAAKLLGRNTQASVRESVEKRAKVGAGETVAQPHHPGGTPRVRVNRWAKRAMLASLAISLLLAGAGRKRWHFLTGAVFLHALALHLWVHRRHILR